MTFSNDAFAAELQLAKEAPVAKRGGGKGGFRFKPAPEIKFAKEGLFTFDWENPNNGKTVRKAVNQLRFVVVKGVFYYQQWDRSSGDKVKMACTTQKHTITTANGATEGDGTWQIPYKREEVISRYSPIGTKMDPETGEALSCGRCMELGLNKGENEGEECGEQGALIIFVTGWTNDDGDMVDVPGGPFLATLRAPSSSATVYYNYIRKLVSERELNPTQVQTVAGIVPTFNGISNKFDLNEDEPIEADQAAAIQAQYTEAEEAWKAQRKADWDAKKAQQGGGKGGAQAKPAAKAATAKSVSKPAATGGSDIDF